MSMNLPRKLLIANRGEIACRIIRTCRRLGVLTVAVYSDADRNSLHVRSADEAVRLGPPPAQESYLSIPSILHAAQISGADAVHPGYGFLSENAAFAEACVAAGLIFVGPTPEAIRAMGSKSEAKLLMQRAGVPLTPGYQGEDQRPEFLLEQAACIGFPVLIKASAGGGGKGMRRVDRAGDFLAALGSCKREASAAFGDDRVLIERYVLQPRHIEVQIFGDSQGNIVSVFERDCSVQRRHQKVLEEAPAPGLSDERRLAISQAAREAARAVKYIGAGTVEFIVDQSGNFHFMEMNTRLQVEHPVTEMVTGLDLVEWQLRVAVGEQLPLTQDELALRGHSIEARIYAEDPANDFAPSVGKLEHLRLPSASQFVRVDTGVEQGDEVTPWYDPMIAKLIVWDQTRAGAVKRLSDALQDFEVVGVKTNIRFLHRLVNTRSFTAPQLDTDLLQRERDYLFAEEERVPVEASLFAVLALLLREAESARTLAPGSPWSRTDGWRLAGALARRFTLTSASQPIDLLVTYTAGGYTMRIANGQFNDDLFVVQDVSGQANHISATLNGHRLQATVLRTADTLQVFLGGNTWECRWQDPLHAASGQAAEESTILSPVPGIISAVLVEAGAFVEKDTPVIVLEAMKMEYTIAAPGPGYVRELFYAKGDQVPEGKQLFHFEPSGEGSPKGSSR